MCGISLPIDEMDSMGAFPGGSDESLGQSKEATTLTIIHHCSFQKLQAVKSTRNLSKKGLLHLKAKFCLNWSYYRQPNTTKTPILDAYPIQCWPDNLHFCPFWMWKIWCQPELCPSFTRLNFLANCNSRSWSGSLSRVIILQITNWVFNIWKIIHC